MALPHGTPPEVVVDGENVALTAAIRRAQRGERVAVVDGRSRPVAAIVSLDDAERLRLDDLRRERAAAAIRAFGELFEGDGRADLDRRVAAAVAEAGSEVWSAWFPDEA